MKEFYTKPKQERIRVIAGTWSGKTGVIVNTFPLHYLIKSDQPGVGTYQEYYNGYIIKAKRIFTERLENE